MNSSVFIEQDPNITIRELLDQASLKELAGHFVAVHHLGMVVLTPEGEALVNTIPGPGASGSVLKKMTEPLPKRGESREIDGGTGTFYRVNPILNDMQVIGVVALGPYTRSAGGAVPVIEAPQMNLLAQMMQSTMEVLVFASYKRHLTNLAHLEAMTDSYQQLEKANQELQASFEQLKEIDQMKSNFLAVVSHELRTPLTSVIGYSEMLLEGIAGELNETQRNYVMVIMEKGDQLLKLIKEILNLSKIEAGKMKLEYHALNPKEIVNLAIETIRPVAEKNSIALSVDFAPEVPDELQLDRDKLLQIYNNLLSNAVKFSNDGGQIAVHLSISGGRQSKAAPSPGKADRFLLSCVEDRGIGIPAECLERIFEKFFQVDSSSTRAFGGTGLGLAITRSFVELHGGSIWAESQVDQGTRLYFTLPLVL